MDEQYCCNKCGQTKSKELFTKQRKTLCISCRNEYAHTYRLDNNDEIKRKNKKWYEEKGKDLKKEYDKENLERVRERERNRYASDENFRMRKILRTRLLKTIKGIKSSKQLLKYLAVDVDSFIKWIEYQWDNEWTWQNYADKWVIDHVRPCSSFDLTTEEGKAKCFHWSNMRPLSMKDNSIKSNKVDEDIINNHQQIVEKFLYISTKVN